MSQISHLIKQDAVKTTRKKQWVMDNYSSELLEALKSCVEIWEDLYSSACDIDGDQEEIETFEKAAAIIAKATGN